VEDTHKLLNDDNSRRQRQPRTEAGYTGYTERGGSSHSHRDATSKPTSARTSQINQHSKHSPGPSRKRADEMKNSAILMLPLFCDVFSVTSVYTLGLNSKTLEPGLTSIIRSDRPRKGSTQDDLASSNAKAAAKAIAHEMVLLLANNSTTLTSRRRRRRK
jgi:hypothetical protein